MSMLDNINLDGIKLENLPVAELVDLAKIKTLVGLKKEEEIQEEKKVKVWVIILAIVGVIALGAAVGYLIYRYMKPEFLEDFEDEFDEDVFDEEDIFDDEDLS